MLESEPDESSDKIKVGRSRRGVLGLVVFLAMGTLMVGRGDFSGRATGGVDGAEMGCGGGGMEESTFLEADDVDVYISPTPVSQTEQGLTNYPNCLHAYEHVNYGGKHYKFWCDGRNSRGWGRKISSFKVPRNRKLTVYQNGTQGGPSKVFVGDNRNVGNFNDKIVRLTIQHQNESGCIIGYDHEHYGGDRYPFCSGGTSVNAWTDRIASFEVPDGMKVKGCVDAGGTLCRTYFKNTPKLRGMKDTFSWLQWGGFNEDNFVMVMMSDPQFDYCDSSECQNGPGNADVANDWHVASIKKVKDQHGSNFAGIIINGDITHLEEQDELSDYKHHYEHVHKLNIYPGLGNHDYDNYADKWCMANDGGFMKWGCSMNILDWFRNRLWTIPVVSVDFEKVGSGWTRDLYEGSMAYSFDIGPYHFIQLNNHPHYSRRIGNTVGWDTTPYFNITKSFDWLEADLAANANKRTILNLHVMSTDKVKGIDRFALKETTKCGAACVSDFNRFLGIIDNHPQVQAIFAGHIHAWAGDVKGGVTTPEGRTVPVYFGGGAERNLYTKVRYKPHEMTIKSIDSTNGNVNVTNTVTQPVVMP